MLTCPSCGKENPAGFQFCGYCAAPLAETTPVREQRKTVTALFCDLTGSTALGGRLDPEQLRAVLTRYFDRMRAIIERHGGTVEKFIGDAVVALFGVPRVHEDDALRAVRAAAEMRAALPELGVDARIGVNTGEVVASAERATGDAMNMASRLQQAAQPNEVLLGAETLQLVRDAVEVEALEPLVVKGKDEPVAAFRLLAVAADVDRAHDAPMVGRHRELDRLRDAFDQAIRDRSCQLFTVLGTAGVGKSRLAAEFLQNVEAATVLRGRCLSYGEGITYWPVVEVLKQLEFRPEDEEAARTISRVLGDTTEPTTPQEIAWATRKTLEGAAAKAPLVCVLDDLHWGESALFDLIEHISDLSRDAPILLLCMARPELLDRRPGWAGGKLNATTVLLEPLSAVETEELIEQLLEEQPLADSLRRRIRDAAEGNPLFVEEMLAMVRESTDDAVVVPPTIQALLAARLDQLEASERLVLECGAVEGKIFHRTAVEALATGEPDVLDHLQTLVRKDLLRPERALIAGDDAFRFRHLLVRDAAYEALPKAQRAELHALLAEWLQHHDFGLVELDEILGYHLEQACRYRAELGLASDESVAARARSHLAEAGRRALLRQDFAAAANLLERAVRLVGPSEIDVALTVDASYALFFVGVEESALFALAAVARAQQLGDRAAELCFRIQHGVTQLFAEPEGVADELTELVQQALPLFEAQDDVFGRYIACVARMQIAHMRGQFDAALEAGEQALVEAGGLDLPHLEHRLLPYLSAYWAFGPRPLEDGFAWFDEVAARGGGPFPHVACRAVGLAKVGRLDEGRALFDSVRADLEERGSSVPLGVTLLVGAEAEWLIGNAARAAELAQVSCDVLEQNGERSWLSTSAGLAAQAFYGLGRYDEAETWAERAEEMGASDDAVTQMLWRQVQAKLAARREQHDEAQRLISEAVAIGDEIDQVEYRGAAYADLAEVHALAGSSEDAVAALERAVEIFGRKGNVVTAKRWQTRADELRSPAGVG